MNRPHRKSVTSLASLALILLASTTSTSPPACAAGETSRDWTATLDADPVWQTATPSGVLVVGTEAGLLGLDGNSGKTLWRIGDLKDHDVTLDVLLPDPYALLRLKKGIRGSAVRLLIDVTTGREIWDSSKLGLTDVYHESYVPSLGVLLVAGKAAERKVVVAVDLESGRRLSEIAVPEGEAGSIFDKPMLFDTESTLVTVSGEGLVQYDLQSGAMRWASPRLYTGRHIDCTFPDTPAGKSGFVVAPNAKRSDPRPLLPTAPMLIASDGQCLVTAWGQTLQAMDAHGLALWRDPPELCGRCVQMVETGHGVLVRTMPEIAGNDQLAMVQPGSGAVLWRYPEISKKVVSIFVSGFNTVAMSNPVIDSTTAYVLAGRHLMRIDLATGRASNVGETRIDEKGVHRELERDGEGFLVVGQQEIEWLDARGKSVRHVHYKPPGNLITGLGELGAIAMVAAIAKQNGFHASASPAAMRAFPRYRPAKSSPDPLYRAIARSMARTFHSSSNLDSLVFMLADLHEADIKGPALVGIHKRSGEPVRRLPVSRKPHYEVDPFAGWIFVMDSKRIRGYAL